MEIDLVFMSYAQSYPKKERPNGVSNSREICYVDFVGVKLSLVSIDPSIL